MDLQLENIEETVKWLNAKGIETEPIRLDEFTHNLVNLFRCMRDRPIALIDEIGYFNLNSREEFNSIKKFFKDEKFNDRFIDDEI